MHDNEWKFEWKIFNSWRVKACLTACVKWSYPGNYSPSITAPQGFFDLKELHTFSQTGTNTDSQKIQTRCDPFVFLTQIHWNTVLVVIMWLNLFMLSLLKSPKSTHHLKIHRLAVTTNERDLRRVSGYYDMSFTVKPKTKTHLWLIQSTDIKIV